MRGRIREQVGVAEYGGNALGLQRISLLFREKKRGN